MKVKMEFLVDVESMNDAAQLGHDISTLSNDGFTNLQFIGAVELRFTIKELVTKWHENRLAKLTEMRAPQVVIDGEKTCIENVPGIEGMDKYGDLIVKSFESKYGSKAGRYQVFTTEIGDIALFTNKWGQRRLTHFQDPNEECIYPPKIFTGDNQEVDYECYTDAMNNRKVGDMITHFAGAPGTGKVSYRITWMDETGVYGIKIEDTVRELDPEEVR